MWTTHRSGRSGGRTDCVVPELQREYHDPFQSSRSEAIGQNRMRTCGDYTGGRPCGSGPGCSLRSENSGAPRWQIPIRNSDHKRRAGALSFPGDHPTRPAQGNQRTFWRVPTASAQPARPLDGNLTGAPRGQLPEPPKTSRAGTQRNARQHLPKFAFPEGQQTRTDPQNLNTYGRLIDFGLSVAPRRNLHRRRAFRSKRKSRNTINLQHYLPSFP